MDEGGGGGGGLPSLLSMLYDAFFVCDLTNGPFHQKLI